mgnify:CR=1 FL=1
MSTPNNKNQKLENKTVMRNGKKEILHLNKFTEKQIELFKIINESL